jgi:hypothetical protein
MPREKKREEPEKKGTGQINEVDNEGNNLRCSVSTAARHNAD